MTSRNRHPLDRSVRNSRPGGASRADPGRALSSGPPPCPHTRRRFVGIRRHHLSVQQSRLKSTSTSQSLAGSFGLAVRGKLIRTNPNVTVRAGREDRLGQPPDRSQHRHAARWRLNRRGAGRTHLLRRRNPLRSAGCSSAPWAWSDRLSDKSARRVAHGSVPSVYIGSAGKFRTLTRRTVYPVPTRLPLLGSGLLTRHTDRSLSIWPTEFPVGSRNAYRPSP